MKEKNGRNLKKHPFNDKTEDGVKFRLQDHRRKLQYHGRGLTRS